jgi:Spy/CpxP family protein refolding chaperone
VKLPKWPEKSRAVVYVLLIFLCGIVTGALAHNLWHRWERERGQSVTQAAPRQTRTQRTVERFTRDLSLTPEQAQQLTVILDETRQKYRSQEDATRREARDRIRAILNDDQRAIYEEIIAHADKRRRQQRDSEGSAPPTSPLPRP